MGRINWWKRGAKLLASFITGYGAVLSAFFSLQALSETPPLSPESLFIYPLIGGVVVAMPQASKVLTEYGNS